MISVVRRLLAAVAWAATSEPYLGNGRRHGGSGDLRAETQPFVATPCRALDAELSFLGLGNAAISQLTSRRGRRTA